MDLPVIVGAVVVGLIAVGVFYFTRAEPIKPAPPVEPAKGAPTVTAGAPVMKDTKGVTGTGEAGGAAAGAAGGTGTNPYAGVAKRPVIAGG